MLLRGNYVFVSPGQKAFLAASNYVNYIELGHPASDGFFLIAAVEQDEFVISARLYNERGELVCEIRNNSVREHRHVTVHTFQDGGYEVVDDEGGVVLRLSFERNRDRLSELCLLQGRFYDERGQLVAEGDDSDLRIYRPPAALGRSGAARGIVLEAPVTKPL